MLLIFRFNDFRQLCRNKKMVSFCVLPSTQLALQKGLIIMKKAKNELPIKVYETKHGTRYMFSFYAGQNTDKNYSRTIQKRVSKIMIQLLLLIWIQKKRLKTAN